MDAFLNKNSNTTNNTQFSNSTFGNSTMTNSGFGNAGINVNGTHLPKNLKITSWILFIISLIFSILLI